MAVNLDRITPVIFIRATVQTTEGIGEVTIEGSHTNVTLVRKNGDILFKADPAAAAEDPCENIKGYTLRQLVDYAKTVPLEEIAFLKRAFETDSELLEEGMREGPDPHDPNHDRPKRRENL